MLKRKRTPTSTSYCVTKLIACPDFPALAVRPTRWIYVLLSGGRSKFTTISTDGISSPLAATSVATRISRLRARNFPNAPRRADCESCPCNGIAPKPSARSRMARRCVSFTVRVNIMADWPANSESRFTK